MMVTIYRVENAQGQGMYRNDESNSGEWLYAAGIDDAGGPAHPAPWYDDDISDFWELCEEHRERHLYFFGFGSIESFMKWVWHPESRRVLRRWGFALVVYEVTAEYACVGEKQAVFRKDKATVVKRLEVDHLDRHNTNE